MPDAVVMQAVRKTFGPKVAVTDMDLAIRTGSVCAFLGPNGAGKTTTIRMIMSILFPDSGDIRVLGKASAVESKDRIGYLPEERGVYRKMKVAPFLAYMGRLKGLSGAEVKRRVPMWLEKVGLADVAKKKCEELSKGMQQKVQFVASVFHEPDLIILDEPFSGLDPVNARLLRDLVDEQHRQGRTIIFSTHVMEHAEQLCDHVLMINRGVKVLDETMAGIRSKFEPHTLIVEPMDEATGIEPFRAAAGLQRAERVGSAYEMRFDERVSVEEAMRSLFAAGPVRRLEVKRIKLEDVFIELVGATGGAGHGNANESAVKAAAAEVMA
ncbi:MAG: ABC transporter ATP-binding protein [Phycisphaerales bacterium]